MNANETISIIIPVYNVAEYLDDCMSSVVSQTYDNLEIIVIDDGSTDGSGELCDNWAHCDGRITVLHQANGGLSAARNAGLDCISGKYILFIDSDDIVATTYVETLYRSITEMGTLCVVCGFSEFGKGRKREIRATEETMIISSQECLAWAMAPSRKSSHNVPVAVWCKIYRRSLFEDAGIRFPEGEVYENVAVMFPIVHSSGRVGLIPDVLYFKRDREDSIVNTDTEKSIKDLERAQEKFAQAIKGQYPGLCAEADRYLEKTRITLWIRYHEIWMESSGDEAREGANRMRIYVVEHQHDLVLPTDLRKKLTVKLLCIAPSFASAARRLWMRLKP